jgi:predicted ATP-grasp superfamily ATP-dependent carboligase
MAIGQEEEEMKRIGEIELAVEELPTLGEPHALAVIKPWIDVNNAGSLVLSRWETLFGAEELGRLARPGEFFDYTRYRPTIYLEEDVHHVRLPNIEIRYAKREVGNDLIFLHLLEPHMRGEAFVESILKFLRELGVRRYTVLGSMFDAVPHTKPLIVTGEALGEEAERALNGAGVRSSDYQGPTTIAFLINQLAPERGIESLWFIVSLPHYVQVEEDHMGTLRLLEVLSAIYGLPVPQEELAKAEDQRRNVDRLLQVKPELQVVIGKLEEFYEERARGKRLSPEVERFLRELSKGLGD